MARIPLATLAYSLRRRFLLCFAAVRYAEIRGAAGDLVHACVVYDNEMPKVR